MSKLLKNVSFQNTVDESTILAGAPPIPAARSFYKNKDGEVDLSNDEYGAHTFTKKVGRVGGDA